MRHRPFLSVIIPTLNEENNLETAISSVKQGCVDKCPEIIVVDGGSSDKTLAIAEDSRVKVVQCNKGRGRQLNQGWRKASGDWVLFLHGDCRLPIQYDRS
eukprot:TRINITY_DN67979_c0_g1_i1.p2 TRINITY_DN67979_c0_g1~~TRINITY_DN67979_c0_g1_i1.p2  ORF type:complete len:100 (-),score=6.16 TRINITY_DN67979_c0_g1_i1:42-341(-)